MIKFYSAIRQILMIRSRKHHKKVNKNTLLKNMII